MTSRRPFLACIALACAGLLPHAGRAGENTADPAAVREAVDRAVRPLMAQYQVPGMAVAVTAGGRTMFFNYGVSAKEGGAPVDENTLFELGSLSKTFTATLAGYALAQGKLALDDHPGRFLAQLQGSALDKATLLDLGAYAAGGLPQQVPDEVTNDEQMIAWFRAWQPDAAPGTQRRYSNPSIGLFGRVAALALHMDFSEAVEGQLFPALGLNNSYIHVPPAAMAHYAWGMDKANQPVRVRPDVLDAETYGVKSSAADMIRFVQLNMDPGSLAPAMRRAVEATHVGYFRIGDTIQGLGWEQYRAPYGLPTLVAGNSDKMSGQSNPAVKLPPPQAPLPGTLFNKTGSTRGFGTYAAFVPDQRIGVVLLANRNYPNAARVEAAYAILQQLRTPDAK